MSPHKCPPDGGPSGLRVLSATSMHPGFGMLMTMASRKKKSKFKVTKEARRRARLGIGLPPPERVIVEKRHKTPKHKKTLADLIDEGK